MKNLITIALGLLLIVSCKKEQPLTPVQDVKEHTLILEIDVEQMTFEIPHDFRRRYFKPIVSTQLLSHGRIKINHEINSIDYEIKGINEVTDDSGTYKTNIEVTQKSDRSFILNLQKSNHSNIYNKITIDIIQ